MFNLFFTTRIPDDLRFQSFSARHLILLLFAFAGIVLIARRIKLAGHSRRENALTAFTWALPCIYLLRFTVFFLLDMFVEPQMSLLDRMPFHLCTLNAIVMPLGVATKNRTLLAYMYAIALPGAVAAMLTPAMSYYGTYFWLSWQVVYFYIDHAVMVLVPVLTVITGVFRPHIRYIPEVLGIFVPYTAIIYAANKLLGENWLFLSHPDEGTVMAWFALYLGNPGYLVGLAALTAAIILLMHLPWRKKISVKT